MDEAPTYKVAEDVTAYLRPVLTIRQRRALETGKVLVLKMNEGAKQLMIVEKERRYLLLSRRFIDYWRRELKGRKVFEDTGVAVFGGNNGKKVTECIKASKGGASRICHG